MHRLRRVGGGAGAPPANLGLQARIIGIDDSEAALEYARRNAAGTAVELMKADVTELASRPSLLSGLDGGVDLVVANPPYVPDGARPWNPKSPNMIHTTRCSAGRTAWR